jgi:catechol 2,3-dioxygenase-like lactoylglutathione lyase family enzyme
MRPEVLHMPTFINAAATLAVADLGRARTFYEETLGLTAEEENPGGILYRVATSQLFVYPSEFAGSNKATAASLEVSDLDSTVSELRGAGVTFEEYDFPGLKTENGIADLEGDRGAWFKDPDGNILSVVQRKAQ